MRLPRTRVVAISLNRSSREAAMPNESTVSQDASPIVQTAFGFWSSKVLRRFRPNIVVNLLSGEKGFAENGWIGHTICIGDEVRLNVTGPCPRCVMTTLPQGDLPKDPGILRMAAQHNHVNVGVYANVVRGGSIRRGDPVR